MTIATHSELFIDQLTCARNERYLFSPISFQLKPGEMLHVRGPNGIGKTTLLRCLAGLIRPAAGVIKWSQEMITESEDYHCILRYVGHKSGVKASLSVLENLKWSVALETAPSKSELSDALHRFGLLDLQHRLASTLSSGQKQRLSLASLALGNAKVWLLDEPFNSLDDQSANMIMAIFQERIATGGIIILTAHQTLPSQSIKVLDLIPYKAEV